MVIFALQLQNHKIHNFEMKNEKDEFSIAKLFSFIYLLHIDE
jgi:hypothetical protein